MTALREIRQRAGVSQVALAKKLGVTSSTVTQWESGVRNPNIVMIKRIANIFGVTTDELLEPIGKEEVEEFCCEVTPETDMTEYLKDREKYIPAEEKILPDVIHDALLEKMVSLQDKIAEEESLLEYYKKQLYDLENYIKDNQIEL